MSSEEVVLKTRGKLLKLGTWYVRALYKAGSFDNALKEINTMKLDIIGLAEVRWTESGKIIKDDYTMIYSGGEEHKNGVGIIMKKRI